MMVQRITHATDGDRCLAIVPNETFADELGLDAMAVHHGASLHRSPDRLQLLARAWSRSTRGDVLAADEAWLAVLDDILRPPRTVAAPAGATAVMQRRAVDRVREAIAADPGARWTMRAISGVAGYAPHHVSRLFSRHAGMTVTGYRTVVRLTKAAALLTDGVPAAAVAARLGFADHSHLTRRSRQLLGLPPSQFGVRRT